MTPGILNAGWITNIEGRGLGARLYWAVDERWLLGQWEREAGGLPLGKCVGGVSVKIASRYAASL
jgi:hypothetical protein